MTVVGSRFSRNRWLLLCGAENTVPKEGELMKCMKTFRKHILQEGAGPEAFEFLRKMENHCLTKMLDASTTQAKISDFLN